MVDIDKIGCVFGNAHVGFDVGDNLIIVIKRFGADVVVAYLYGTNPHVHRQEQNTANKHRTPSSCKEL